MLLVAMGMNTNLTKYEHVGRKLESRNASSSRRERQVQIMTHIYRNIYRSKEIRTIDLIHFPPTDLIENKSILLDFFFFLEKKTVLYFSRVFEKSPDELDRSALLLGPISYSFLEWLFWQGIFFFLFF